MRHKPNRPQIPRFDWQYLASIGHAKRVIGEREVWVRYEKGHVAKVGPTKDSVQVEAAEALETK